MTLYLNFQMTINHSFLMHIVKIAILSYLETTLSLIYIYLSGNAAHTIFRQENHTKTCSLVTANDPETGAVIKLKHKA